MATAPGLLSLAVKHNVPDLEEKAAALVASMIGPHTAAKDAFLQLSIASAKVVLSQDDLKLPNGRELGVFELARA